MKCSVWPEPTRPAAEVLELARLADDDGWYGIWFGDHYMPNTGTTETADGDFYECWALMPAVAAVTTKLRVGPLVSPTSIHHPALLANRAATIDRLSGGRFVLGIGAGWQVNEHVAYGFALDAPGPRVDRFAEAIQVVRSLLTEPRTDFVGEYYRITDAPCQPTPVQTPLPILVGTGSPRMLGITARHADEWNTWGTPEVAAKRRADFDAACGRAGVDPSSMHTSVQTMIIFKDDPETAERVRTGRLSDRTIVGSDEAIIDQLNRYAQLGFDELIVPDFTLGRSAEQRRDAYRRFAADIAPELG